jgi:hypothetical protein
MLRWTALELATASKVGVATIRRVEVVDGEIPVTLANEAAIRGAFETAGIDFIEEGIQTGEGLRFRKPRRPRRIIPDGQNSGVHFIDENGGGPGVRLRKGLPKKR